jgi:translation initiation factor IF-2
MNKMRVYELAREVGLPNKELIQIIKELGIKISNHMNCLNEEQIRMVKKVLDSGASDKVFDRLLRQEMKGREERAEEVMPAAEEAAAIRWVSALMN